MFHLLMLFGVGFAAVTYFPSVSAFLGVTPQMLLTPNILIDAMDAFSIIIFGAVSYTIVWRVGNKVLKSEMRTLAQNYILRSGLAGSEISAMNSLIWQLRKGSVSDQKLSDAFAIYLANDDIRDELRELARASPSESKIPPASERDLTEWRNKVHTYRYFNEHYKIAAGRELGPLWWVFLRLWKVRPERFV